MENRCVCCGEIIPEGIQVCYSCMNSFITDVAPVRHGRWIEKTVPVGKYFECSKCGAHENPHTAIIGGYCWRCGAKMDGGDGDAAD